ncbi:tetratricopeptide repeat protein [Chitinivorax sp. B]|uniref:surface lipoprotein assembly modifier n=1 Tax=Chitinivorax sp. B TaxID=2502235 RepID=UPI0010F62827|nr:tetratricopeptide repeat protein [Chitinivorax sp. B]
MAGVVSRCAIGLLLYAAMASNAWAADELKRAAALLAEGKAKQAYTLLTPLEAERAGDDEFDYLLGTAAIDSGQPARGTLALERLIQRDPNHAGARLEMGRAYFLMGDDTRAKAEFDALLQLNPPPIARQAMTQYLQAIEQRNRSRGTQWSGYVSAGLGHDTNVNAATDKTKIFVPIFGGDLILTDTSTSKSDNLLFAAAGTDFSHPLTENVRLLAGADLRYRHYHHQHDFSFGTLAARGGVAIGSAGNQLRLGTQLDYLRQDHQANRRNLNGTIEWRKALGDSQQVNLFGQFGQIRYQRPEYRINDANQTLLGGSWLGLILPAHNGVTLATLFGGRERAREDRADGDKRMLGARATWQFNPIDDGELWVSAGWQQGHYCQENFLFATRRHDRLTDIGLGFNWRIGGAWSLRPAINHSRNRSNIAINEYRRTDYTLAVQHDFR